MGAKVSMYWSLCVSLHVVVVVSKSESEILASLSYVLFFAYCACDEVITLEVVHV